MKLKLTILFLFLSTGVFASGGSLYTRYGIGDLIYSQSAREFGMANTGIAFSRDDQLGSLNPAGWHSLGLTRFSIGLTFRGYDISDNSTSAFYSQTEFSGISLAFPVSYDYGITIVGGLTPYSNVNYDVILNEDNETFGQHTYQYSGSGGYSKAYFGSSYKLPFDLVIGASFDYYSGKTDYNSKVEFTELTDFQDTEYQISLKNHSLGYTMGLISPDFAKILELNDFSNFRFGFTYSSVASVNVDSVKSYNNSMGFEEFQNINTEENIPDRLGVGLSLTWKEKYTFVFDFVNQKFSNYEINSVKSAYLRDLNRFSLGFEYRHNSGRFGSTWEQMIWRAGLSYEQTQYEINSNGIDEMAAYAGFSFPMGLDNSLDFGVKYGIRGTTDNNLLKENIISAMLTISFGDLWFIRPQR